MADTKSKFLKAIQNNTPKNKTKSVNELLKEQKQKNAEISLKNKNRQESKGTVTIA